MPEKQQYSYFRSILYFQFDSIYDGPNAFFSSIYVAYVYVILLAAVAIIRIVKFLPS